jgi:integrase
MTGMRRNEVLGLKWADIDFAKRRVALNRGLVAVGYELHQTRGKTRAARRNIDLDDTTMSVLSGWRALQGAEHGAVGIANADEWVFTDCAGDPIHPHSLYQAFRRIVANADVPDIRFHACAIRTAAFSSKKAFPSRSSASGSDTPTSHTPSRRISTYSQALAPRPRGPTNASPSRIRWTPATRWNVVGTSGGTPPDPVDTTDNAEGPGR